MLGTLRLSADEQQQRQRAALRSSRVQRLVQVRQQAKRADAERLRAYRTRLISSQDEIEQEIRAKWEEAKVSRCESLREKQRAGFLDMGKGHGRAHAAVLREKANEMHAECVRQVRREATHKRFRSAVTAVRRDRADPMKAQREAEERRKVHRASDRKRAHEFGEKWAEMQKEQEGDGCEEELLFGRMRAVPDFSRTRIHQGGGERGVFVAFGKEEEGNKAEEDAKEERARRAQEKEDDTSKAKENNSRAKDRGEVALSREMASRERERIEGVLEQMQHERNRKRKDALLQGNLANAPILRTWKSKAHQEELQAAFEQAFVGGLPCQQQFNKTNQEQATENATRRLWNKRQGNNQTLHTILEVSSPASSISIINPTRDTQGGVGGFDEQQLQGIHQPGPVCEVGKDKEHSNKNIVKSKDAPIEFSGQKKIREQTSDSPPKCSEAALAHNVYNDAVGEVSYSQINCERQTGTVDCPPCTSSPRSTRQIAFTEKDPKLTACLQASSESSSYIDGGDICGMHEYVSQSDWLDEILEPYLDHCQSKQSAAQPYSNKLEKSSGPGEPSVTSEGRSAKYKAPGNVEKARDNGNQGHTSISTKSKEQIAKKQIQHENGDSTPSISEKKSQLQVDQSQKTTNTPVASEQCDARAVLRSSSSSLGALSDALSFATDSCIDHIRDTGWKPRDTPLPNSNMYEELEHGMRHEHHKEEQKELDPSSHSNTLCQFTPDSICGDTVNGDDASVTSLEIDQLLSGLGRYDDSSSSIISGISTAVADLKQGNGAPSISDTVSLPDSLLDSVLSRSSIIRTACGINPKRIGAPSIASSALQTIIEDREDTRNGSESTRTSAQKGDTLVEPDSNGNPDSPILQAMPSGSRQLNLSCSSVSSSVESLEALLTRLNLSNFEERNISDDTISMTSSIQDLDTSMSAFHPHAVNSCLSDPSHPSPTSIHQDCEARKMEQSTFCGPKSVTSNDTYIESLVSSISGPISSISSEANEALRSNPNNNQDLLPTESSEL